MTISREQEIWAVTLWVEKHHGDVGDIYIAQQIDRLFAAGVLDGVAYWRKVRKQFESLSETEENLCQTRQRSLPTCKVGSASNSTATRQWPRCRGKRTLGNLICCSFPAG